MIDLGAELVPACEIVRTAAVDGLINEYRGQAAGARSRAFRPFTVAERAAHALLLERPETEQYGN